MKKIRFAPSSLLILLVLAAFACKKLPEPAFSYEPAENPEAGEVITFVNETPEASSYIWDFGDGTNATDASPGHTFESAGNYTIKLSATNEDGEASHAETVTIHEATVLGLQVSDTTGKFLLENAEVLIYDNESDWRGLKQPQYAGVTDANGEVYYSNLEDIVYFVLVVKEAPGGTWLAGGSTDPLILNEINLYTAECEFVKDGALKSLPIPPPVPLRRLH